MKKICIAFLSFVFFELPANAQFHYSSTHLDAINLKRVEEEDALVNMDRKALYHLGEFYTAIYRQYGDTSLRAAIRCYSMSAYAEGDFMVNESFLAAFRLGYFYETGLGAVQDPGKAMVYYFLSDTIGKSHFERLQLFWCNQDSVILKATDQLVVTINPFCSIKNTETISFLRKAAASIKQNPALHLKLFISIEEDHYASWYNYWRYHTYPEKVRNEIYYILGEDFDMSRMEIEFKEERGSFHLLEFKVENF